MVLILEIDAFSSPDIWAQNLIKFWTQYTSSPTKNSEDEQGREVNDEENSQEIAGADQEGVEGGLFPGVDTFHHHPRIQNLILFSDKGLKSGRSSKITVDHFRFRGFKRWEGN